MTSVPEHTPKLRLGTRQSPLAMAQALEARERLCAVHGWNAEDIELVPVLASGDRIQDRALADIGGKALWTRELDLWLAEGRIDAAVHSMKDVETLRPDSLTIAAILPRADKADVLLGAPSIVGLPRGATIGTSAPRRAAQLLSRRPDCRVVTFRGNVATRQRKLAEGEVDATFLAAAGLDRLGERGIGTRLDPQDWLPAPAQAAIGIECRRDADEVRNWLSAIDHAPSHAEVMAERALLNALGGSCHSAIACLTQREDQDLSIRAAIFSPNGSEKIEGYTRFAFGDKEAPQALGRSLLAQASAQLRATFAGAA
ncbi:MAG: hydroxymethylbilane synthase [Sphingomonadaceae bacterium]